MTSRNSPKNCRDTSADSVTEASKPSDSPQKVLGGLRGASDPLGRLRKLRGTADGLGRVPSSDTKHIIGVKYYKDMFIAEGSALSQIGRGSRDLLLQAAACCGGSTTVGGFMRFARVE